MLSKVKFNGCVSDTALLCYLINEQVVRLVGRKKNAKGFFCSLSFYFLIEMLEIFPLLDVYSS